LFNHLKTYAHLNIKFIIIIIIIYFAHKTQINLYEGSVFSALTMFDGQQEGNLARKNFCLDIVMTVNVSGQDRA